MEYETVIGLEVHAQLLTKSKMFCGCSADYANAAPNTHVCPVCLGMPGVLPVINRRAVEFTIMTALALNCEIPQFSKFDRKNYPYPDLMKGYQISQYDAPLSRRGWLAIQVKGAERRIGITRVHLEEDTAKLMHVEEGGERYSLVDVNRAGVPLMEIVSEPDLRSPEEARAYLVKLRSILQFLGVSSGNMEEGSFRCDANVSVRPAGAADLGAKVEVKNMNSFRSVYRALAFEEERQRAELTAGGRIVQETRGWVEDRGVTVPQRTKEYAHDYRYFPEPDLPPLVLSREWVEEIRRRLPELPDSVRRRMVATYGLPDYDADLLTASRAMARFFEETVELVGSEVGPKVVSNYLLGDVTRLLNAAGIEIEESKLSPALLAGLLRLVASGDLSGKNAKEVLEEMFSTGRQASEVVASRGLTQVSDEAEIAQVVERVISANPQAVADYHGGKQQALTFLVGQVMRETRGRANAALVNELLRRKLTQP